MTTIGELIKDRRMYFATMLQIEDKQRNIVPFVLNPVQNDLLSSITGRDAILKARQLGLSTVLMADYLVDCITKPGTVSVVVSHEDFSTQRLFKKAKFFYDSIPERFRPKLGHGSSYEMTWPNLNSTFYIGTAGARVFGRGDTIHNFLGSEISRWPDPDRIMTAVSESVPVDGRIALESTPNGEGNYFHVACMQALKNESRYRLHFYPWWLSTEYSLTIDSPYAMQEDRGLLVITDDEQQLRSAYGLTDDQFRWRRMKMAEMSLGSDAMTATMKFQEEYPEDIEKCFITTGDRRLYAYEVLDRLMTMCMPPVYITHYGLEVWREPKPFHHYIVGADPSGGMVDPAAAVVWDITNQGEPKHCATLEGLYDPIQFAEKLKYIGEEYNMATLAIERNGPGQAVLTLLRYYPHIYTRHDTTTGREGGVPGWITSRPTKNVMAVEFGRQLETAEIYDRRILMQARGMRRDGELIYCYAHDDVWTAAAVGLAARDNVSVGTSGMISSYGWRW